MGSYPEPLTQQCYPQDIKATGGSHNRLGPDESWYSS